MELTVTGLTFLLVVAYCLNKAEKDIIENNKPKN